MTDERANEVYNKLNFLFSIMFPLLDEAQETTKPMRQVKFHMNRLREEAQKEYKVFFDNYAKDERIEQEDVFDIIFNRHPGELAALVNLNKKLQEQKVDLNQLMFEYKPIKL